MNTGKQRFKVNPASIKGAASHGIIDGMAGVFYPFDSLAEAESALPEFKRDPALASRMYRGFDRYKKLRPDTKAI